MPRRPWSFSPLGWWLLGLLAGCGPNWADYRQALQEQLAVQEEVLRILQGIQTSADLEAAQQALHRLETPAAEAAARLQRLPPPGPRLRAQLETEFAEPLQTLYNKQRQEIARIRALPGGPEFFARLEQLFGAERPSGPLAPAPGR
jgi:hypothetical protein